MSFVPPGPPWFRCPSISLHQEVPSSVHAVFTFYSSFYCLTFVIFMRLNLTVRMWTPLSFSCDLRPLWYWRLLQKCRLQATRTPQQQQHPACLPHSLFFHCSCTVNIPCKIANSLILLLKRNSVDLRLVRQYHDIEQDKQIAFYIKLMDFYVVNTEIGKYFLLFICEYNIKISTIIGLKLWNRWATVRVSWLRCVLWVKLWIEKLTSLLPQY